MKGGAEPLITEKPNARLSFRIKVEAAVNQLPFSLVFLFAFLFIFVIYSPLLLYKSPAEREAVWF